MLSADGGKLYINNEAASTLTVFDTKTMLAEAVIPGFAQPRQGVKLAPDGKTVRVLRADPRTAKASVLMHDSATAGTAEGSGAVYVHLPAASQVA